jgi:hypothetical protein
MKLTTSGSAIVTDTIRYIQGSEPPKQVGENIIAGYTAKMYGVFKRIVVFERIVYRITKASYHTIT